VRSCTLQRVAVCGGHTKGHTFSRFATDFEVVRVMRILCSTPVVSPSAACNISVRRYVRSSSCIQTLVKMHFYKELPGQLARVSTTCSMRLIAGNERQETVGEMARAIPLPNSTALCAPLLRTVPVCSVCGLRCISRIGTAASFGHGHARNFCFSEDNATTLTFSATLDAAQPLGRRCSPSFEQTSCY